MKTHQFHLKMFYPFGMLMGERTFSGENYRWGFNGQEKDDEVTSEGNHYEFKYREYDPRIGKFWSVDPLFKDYPWNSTYAFAENTVIWAMELEGLEAYKTNDGDELGKVEGSEEERVVNLDNSEDALPKEWQIDNLKCMVEKANSLEKNKSELASAFLMGVSKGNDDVKNGDGSYDATGSILALLGGGLSIGSNIYDPKKGTWVGKNFKSYSSNWGGNKRTGGKNKFSGRVSTTFTVVGYGLGLYNAYSINHLHNQGQLSDFQMGLEQGSNAVSTLGGIHGAAWGIGWELGRATTKIPGYHENIRLPLQRILGIIPPEPECILCPQE